ncbi:hypothetical protein BV22DRAFT_299982 [Leucogyrophana mollusca]|uniref:Uncharacterized protein n=1 Tax=Leucogyrophana mollusca TaxID=85980 RepID=A0ACB8BQV4_9AGAM|nr:hypothetical protein BV22DRAFT_299982 [Leucogyrophana mollusca]
MHSVPQIYAPTKILPIQVGNADERPANNAVRTSQTWLEQQQRKYMYRDDIDSDDFEGSQWSGEQCPPYTYDAMTYEPFFDDKSHSPDKSHQAPPDSGHAPAARIQPYPQDKITPRPAPHSQHDIVLPDENIRCMFQECEVAHGRAGLLSEVLVHENPDNLELKVSLCRASQELIYAHIPLVTASAERSRTERRNSVKDGSTSEPTLEEDLLSALLAANEASLEALCMHDDHELIGVERVMPGMVSPTSSHYGQHQHLADKPIPGSTTITPLIADDSSAERARPSPVAAAVAEGELTGRIRRVSLRWLEQHRKTLYVNVIESDTFEGPQWVRDKCTDYIYDPKIYQSLTIYTFSHLAHCVGDPSLLSAFHDHINEWQGWDVFQSLKYHRAIRDSLCALLLKKTSVHYVSYIWLTKLTGLNYRC